jgi:CBS domain-containing protein
MKVSDLMSQKVELASPDDTIQQAAKAMARIDSGMLPVGENDRLVGIITDRDIAIRGVAAGKDPMKCCVRDVMTPEVKYAFEDDDITDVAENMAQLQVRRLPVVNRDKRLVGIISLADIARQQNAREAGRALEGIARPGGPHNQH